MDGYRRVKQAAVASNVVLKSDQMNDLKREEVLSGGGDGNILGLEVLDSVKPLALF